MFRIRRGLVLSRTLSTTSTKRIQRHAIKGLLSREEQIEKLKTTDEFDILVVGAGSTGAGCALDACTRGLKVAVIERGDFSNGTSSRSTKLLHGGIRYMQAAFLDHLLSWKPSYKNFVANMKLVFNALRERNHLLQTAPHLTNWLPIMVPFYKWFRFPHSLLVPGMVLYDAMGRFQKHSYVLNKRKTLEVFPMLKAEGLKYSAVFWEGQQNDSRTNIAIALTAAEYGATVANYVELRRFTHDTDGRVSGAIVQDLETGKDITVKAKKVILAGGPFTDHLRRLEDPKAKEMVTGAGGAHIVVPNYYSPQKMGLADMATSDGRLLFFLPWMDHTIVGTTDHPSEISRLPFPMEDEVQWILNEVDDYLSKDLQVRRKDVLSAWSGIRPLVSDPTAKSTKSISRDHVITVHPTTGVITITGGKWTTYREMAEDAIDRAVEESNGQLQAKKCVTLQTKLIGADGYSPNLHIKLVQQYGVSSTVAKYLASTYGQRAFELLDMAAPTGKTWPKAGVALVEGYPFIDAEVKYAIKEYARSAIDVLAFRTRLAFLNVTATREALPRVIEIMKEELGWDETRCRMEEEKAQEFLATFGGPEPIKEGAALRASTTADIRTCFERVDLDGNKSLDRDEIAQLANDLGFTLTATELNQAINNMDTNKDGRVDFDEFCAWWNSEKNNKTDCKLAKVLIRSDLPF